SRRRRRKSRCERRATSASPATGCARCSCRRRAKARRCWTAVPPRWRSASRRSSRRRWRDRGHPTPPPAFSVSPESARVPRATCQKLAGGGRMSVLIIAEHLHGQVRPITLELVSAAKALDDETALAVIAKDPAAIADQVDVEGVNEIVSVKVDQDEFEND